MTLLTLAGIMVDWSILGVVVATATVLFIPRLSNAILWRATITPLASIIGSGFLVLGPILLVSYGRYAPLVMALLCIMAYAFGAAIRSNIATLDTGQKPSVLVMNLELLASWTLAVAYIISVAYYLNLFGAFGVSLISDTDVRQARELTSLVFLLILAVGWTQGFSALERLEQFAVGLKLAIISGLLWGLVMYFGVRNAASELHFPPASLTGWPALTLAFGLIVTVQGFETSRYLGNTYNSAIRIRSMRIAQILSTTIYMAYILLLSYVFEADALQLDETAIIDMMSVVSPILPMLLVAAALSAQFSAAVADTSGSGGLLVELTRKRLSARQAYLLLVLLGLTLTWTADVFQIISHASRAFALYYSLQAAIAAVNYWQEPRNSLKAVSCGLLCVMGITITLFGVPVE